MLASRLRNRFTRHRRKVVAYALRAWRRPRSLFDPTTLELFALSWPIVLGMLGETAVGLVDVKLVGGLGREAIGGVGIGSMLMFLCFSVVYGLMRAVKVRSAHALGEGRAADARAYAYAGVAIGAALGVGFFALGRDVSWVLRLAGTDERLVPAARDFFAAVMWGAPAAAMLGALVQHRQGLSDAKTPLRVAVVGNVANVILALVLIHGLGPIPSLGVAGAGYGTAASQWLQVSLLAGALVGERDAPRSLSLGQAAREVLTLGVPTGLQFGFEMLAFAAFTALLGSLGPAEIAAHQVALMILRTSFLPGVAVGEAASVLVGQALGRRDPEAAERALRSALRLAMTFMAACGVGFALFGGKLASAFTDDADVVRVASRLLALAAVFQLLDAANIVLRGALRGAKDVRVPALVGIATMWLTIPGSAWLLGRQLGWGALGGWCGFVLETTVGAGLLYWRWRKTAPSRARLEVCASLAAA